MREASLLFCLPDNPFFEAQPNGHAVQEATYAYAGWIFSQHFLNRLGTSYANLLSYLDENDPAQATVLSEIRTKLREETFTRQSVQDVILAYPELVCDRILVDNRSRADVSLLRLLLDPAPLC
jgi:glutamate dehydrogenase